MKIRVNEIGQERNRVVVIDDIFPQASRLPELAARRAFADVTESSYPGLRYQLSAQTLPEWNYVLNVLSTISPVLGDAFGLKGFTISYAGFSLMTKRAGQAHPLTRIPHYDEITEGKYAVLHFLTASAQGGTGFYRHKRTGFERISPERKVAFHQGLRDDFEAYGEPPVAFINGSNEAYEQIAAFEGRFNRLLIYSGALLHSAHVPADFQYSPDPQKGRLTTNLFLQSA
jgi:hypothetical protein